MRTIRIATVNFNSTVGAISSNMKKIKKFIYDSLKYEPNFIVFPEMCLPGYPCEDLVLWQKFNIKQEEEINDLIKEIDRITVNKIDFPTIIIGVSKIYNSQVYNCALLIHEGRQYYIPKKILPNYGVFYDGRTFSSWENGVLCQEENFTIGDCNFVYDEDIKFNVSVCEDIWSTHGTTYNNDCHLFFNISASPFRFDKEDIYQKRERLLSIRSGDTCSAIVYVNSLGGNDSLVFDGGTIIASCGKIYTRSTRWQEEISVVDLNLSEIVTERMQNTTFRSYSKFNQKNEIVLNNGYSYENITYAPNASRIVSRKKSDELIDAVMLGLNDYYTKLGCFNGVAVSLSGGRDSVLATMFAKLWKLTYENDAEIWCISQPSKFNSEETMQIANELPIALGCFNIENWIDDAFEDEVNATKRISGLKEIPSITMQNIQARIRASRMWNLCNAKNLLWIQTGNMSEKSVGYTTVGGDLQGGFSLLGNMTKTEVNGCILECLLKFNECLLKPNCDKIDIRSIQKIILEDLFENTKASAELSNNQEDERDLMPFDILDPLFMMYAGEKMDVKDIAVELFKNQKYKNEEITAWINKFVKLFHSSIFKWVVSPESIHLKTTDLDRERALQIPVVHKTEWL
jgi:NAD+ synthase (glutamine-hydrolysing)